MAERILVTKAALPELDEYIDEIRSIWDTHWLTNMGQKHDELKKRLTEYLDVDDLELMVNGHMALELAIQSFELSGEVITTPFTFASTTHAIVRNNLTPVFCDINPDDYTMDINKIESLITDKTSAIIPVHVYGNICNVDAIQDIADKYGLKVIYDAAHAFGVKKDGKGVGSYGDASCFSFHATKVFNTIEGGAVCFHDASVGKKIYRLKNFGIKNEENVDGIGANAKMNEFCAAMGLCNLKHIDGWIEQRKQVVERYKEQLDGVDGLQLCGEQKGVETNYSYFPLVIHEDRFGSTRNEVTKALADEGIIARKYFYPLTSTFECYHGRFNANSTPTALYISKRVVTLPLYPDLSLDEVDRICGIVKACKK